MKSLENRFSFASRNEQRIIEYAPKWRGAYLIFGMIFLYLIFLFSVVFVFLGGIWKDLGLGMCMFILLEIHL